MTEEEGGGGEREGSMMQRTYAALTAGFGRVRTDAT